MLKIQQQRCKPFTGLSIRAEKFDGEHPLLLEILPKLTNPFINADFQSIFARSTSDVTPSENSSININRKSTTGLSNELKMNSVCCPHVPKGWI